MELLRVVKRRSLLSETIYVLLNVALAVAVLVVILATGTPWLAIALILLSKWRILAVRPRFWFAHIESNMVDIIVNVSIALLIYYVGQSGGAHASIVQIILAALYAGWLLFLKPRSKRTLVAAQAAVAVTVGTMALSSFSYEWPSSLVVLVMWLIGYSAARHVLVAHSDKDARLFSIIWGFVTAELGWLAFHWTIAYVLPFAGGLKLPQVTLLILGISFLGERVYASFLKHGTIKSSDIGMPLIFVLGIMFILLTLFNAAGIGAA